MDDFIRHRLRKDLRQAARIMAETGTFETGVGLLEDAANEIDRLMTELTEARMQSLTHLSQAQEAHEAKVAIESELARGKDGLMFETITYQVQFWAEIGESDGCGMGYMQEVTESKPFPTFDEAEQWLTDQGWIYDDRALRRLKGSNPYGLARTRRYEEADRTKWIASKEDPK